MREHRFVIEARKGDTWFVVTGGDTATLALRQFSAQKEIRDCRLVRNEDFEVVSSWSPDSRTWDPNPFARADGWQLAQAPIWDLRLHILARVPTIPIEHHVEVAALAQRVLAAADEGKIELSQFENENILWELEDQGEDWSFRRVVHCLRLLGHLSEDHPLVEDARRDLEGVTPLINRGSALLYESTPNWAKGSVSVEIHEADSTGMKTTRMSFEMKRANAPEDYDPSSAVIAHVDSFLRENPGAVCLARKQDDGLVDNVAEPRGAMREVVFGQEVTFGEKVVYIGQDVRGEIGFSVLQPSGERWDVLDPNGSFVACEILDLPTARCIAINHCLSGEKCYRV